MKWISLFLTKSTLNPFSRKNVLIKYQLFCAIWISKESIKFLKLFKSHSVWCMYFFFKLKSRVNFSQTEILILWSNSKLLVVRIWLFCVLEQVNTHSSHTTDKKFSKKHHSEKVIAKSAYNFRKYENKTKKIISRKLQNITVHTWGFNRWVLVSPDHWPSLVQVS